MIGEPQDRTALGQLTVDELTSLLTEFGAPAFRARQLRQQSWGGDFESFDQLSLLPATLRAQLNGRLAYLSLSVKARRSGDRGLTTKLLLAGSDGQEIETVLIRHPAQPGQRARHTVCVSSQVGCSIGCVFCATGQLGLRRQLTAAEIVDQVRLAASEGLRAGWGPPTNVVFMGMGEPLQNFEAVRLSIHLLKEWGVSPRHVVVSTSGLVPQMDRLAEEGLPVRLALSLHSATDELRDRLVPLNRKYPIGELAKAVERFTRATGRRATLEYVLMRGVNDSPQDALELRRLADRLRAHVNLIPMNPISGSTLAAPTEAQSRAFAALVGQRATIRFSRGSSAEAACGQLRAQMQPSRILHLTKVPDAR